MADSKINVPDGAAPGGADTDTEKLAGATHRQRMEIAGALLAEIARVTNVAPNNVDYGLVTRTLLYDSTGAPLVTVGIGNRLAVDVASSTPLVVDSSGSTGDVTGSSVGVWDSGGVPIDPATKQQLPAALAAHGGLKIEGVAAGVAVPVSLAAAIDVLDRAGRLLGLVDMADVDTRILGRVKLRDTANVLIDPMPKTGGTIDVIDRVGRALGVVASITAAVDVSDRAGRALGAVSSVQLPAALAAGGGMKVEGVAGGVAQPVSSAQLPAALVSARLGTSEQERETGYANLALYAEAVAGVIAETAITIQKSLAYAAPAGATSNGASAAKELVILGVILGWISTSTTANTARLRIRVNPAGAAIITSPIAWTMRMAWNTATFIANEGATVPFWFDKAIVIPNPGQFMATIACAAANGTLDVQLIAYERTP